MKAKTLLIEESSLKKAGKHANISFTCVIMHDSRDTIDTGEKGETGDTGIYGKITEHKSGVCL